MAGGNVRVVVVIATEAVREAAERHHASPAATVALGRGSMAALLLATLTKDNERVSLQVLGDGPLGSVNVDANSAGTVRAFVRHPFAGPSAAPRPRLPATATPAPGDDLPFWVGRTGAVSVIRDIGLGEPFTGQTPLASGEIDEDVERYLLDSEQIDSALACEVALDAAGEVRVAVGILVQALPNTEGTTLVSIARELMRDGALTAALPASAQVGIDHVPDLVRAVASFGAGDTLADLRVLERRPVRFHCPCSRERAVSTMELLGPTELADMIATDGRADVTCDFCRRQYQFTAEDLEAIRAGLLDPARPN